MNISRRAFLDLCKGSAIGLGALQVAQLGNLLANPSAPTVVWLQGASCTGCSVSLLNRISTTAPKTVSDVLVQTINLTYHPNLMAPAGESAVDVLEAAQNKCNFVLAVEGGVPTAFGGAACWAYSTNGTDVTFLSAVKALASRALAVMAVGTCASYGGVPSTGVNPA
jgi:hydrogenase small subunit